LEIFTVWIPNYCYHFLIEAIIAWKDDINKALFMLGFSIFILLIFFFKRKFRKKIEKKNKL